MLGLLSAMYSFCVCVITLIAGAASQTETPTRCDMDLKGVFENFRYLDLYFHLSDIALCNLCSCYFSNKTANEELSSEFPDIKLTDDVIEGSVHFGQCDINVKKEVMNEFLQNEIARKLISEFDVDQFQIYWNRIERKFDCVGWCQTNYNYINDNKVINPKFNKSGTLRKYLFSDINGGLVHNPGCMKRMLDWLPKMLNTFGSVMLIICVAQVLSIVFVMFLFCDFGLEEHNKPIGRQDDDIQLKADRSNNENDNRGNGM